MKTVTPEVQAKLEEAASALDKTAQIYAGVMAEAQEMAKCLRSGEIAMTYLANERINAEMVTIMNLSLTCSRIMAEALLLDPALKAELDRAMAESRLKTVKREFEQTIEHWTADQCRKAIADHDEHECDERPCWLLLMLEERLARHEFH